MRTRLMTGNLLRAPIPIGVFAHHTGKAVTAVKLTIDSTDTLENTLRVVGALYNVTLEATGGSPTDAPSGPSTDEPAPVAAPRSRSRSRTSQKRQPRARRARAAKNGRARVDTADVRAWARASGYEIADRGRVSANVLTAYKQAHPN